MQELPEYKGSNRQRKCCWVMSHIMYLAVHKFNISILATFTGLRTKTNTQAEACMQAHLKAVEQEHPDERLIFGLTDQEKKKQVCSRGQTLQPLISGSQRDQCCLCSVVWNGLSWQQSFLPNRPRCGIDLCFCFMPGFPEKVEMFENAGGVCGDRGVSVRLYPCVRACGCVYV